MKTIYSGLESSGKSLRLAMVTVDIVERNSKWLKKSGIKRPIYSNLEFTKALAGLTKYYVDNTPTVGTLRSRLKLRKNDTIGCV